MKAFDEWHPEHFTEWKGFSDITGKGVVKTQQEMLEDAFRAGMLAAADMIEEQSDNGEALWCASWIRQACEEG